jgi:phosphoribosylanthranilate isomerase
MRKPLVKVCGMRDSANVAEVCAINPDLMGFVFVPESSRCATSFVTQAMMARVSPEIKKIGVFRDEDPSNVLERVQELGLDGIQLHGGEDASYARTIKKRLAGVFIVKAVEVATGASIESLRATDGVDMFLLDSGSGGTGKTFDWNLLLNYRAPVPFLLAGGISAHNVGGALKIMGCVPQFQGIDINSKVEVSPGIKSVQMVHEVIRRVRGV